MQIWLKIISHAQSLIFDVISNSFGFILFIGFPRCLQLNIGTSVWSPQCHFFNAEESFPKKSKQIKMIDSSVAFCKNKYLWNIFLNSSAQCSGRLKFSVSLYLIAVASKYIHIGFDYIGQRCWPTCCAQQVFEEYWSFQNFNFEFLIEMMTTGFSFFKRWILHCFWVGLWAKSITRVNTKIIISFTVPINSGNRKRMGFVWLKMFFNIFTSKCATLY